MSKGNNIIMVRVRDEDNSETVSEKHVSTYVNRIGDLLGEALSAESPYSLDVVNYARAIEALCNAQSTPHERVHVKSLTFSSQGDEETE
jgi:hypothetical protein